MRTPPKCPPKCEGCGLLLPSLSRSNLETVCTKVTAILVLFPRTFCLVFADASVCLRTWPPMSSSTQQQEIEKCKADVLFQRQEGGSFRKATSRGHLYFSILGVFGKNSKSVHSCDERRFRSLSKTDGQSIGAAPKLSLWLFPPLRYRSCQA